MKRRLLPGGYAFGKRVWGYWFALDGVALGFFVAAAVALITHKCTLIALHGPLPVLGVVFFAPVIFILDLLTLLILHEGLSTTSSLPWRIASMVVSTVIVSCSATFVSLYLEAKAELDWERALEVKLKLSSANGRLEQIGKYTVKFWLKEEAVSVTPLSSTLYVAWLLFSPERFINAWKRPRE